MVALNHDLNKGSYFEIRIFISKQKLKHGWYVEGGEGFSHGHAFPLELLPASLKVPFREDARYPC